MEENTRQRNLAGVFCFGGSIVGGGVGVGVYPFRSLLKPGNWD